MQSVFRSPQIQPQDKTPSSSKGLKLANKTNTLEAGKTKTQVTTPKAGSPFDTTKELLHILKGRPGFKDSAPNVRDLKTDPIPARKSTAAQSNEDQHSKESLRHATSGKWSAAVTKFTNISKLVSQKGKVNKSPPRDSKLASPLFSLPLSDIKKNLLENQGDDERTVSRGRSKEAKKNVTNQTPEGVYDKEGNYQNKKFLFGTGVDYHQHSDSLALIKQERDELAKSNLTYRQELNQLRQCIDGIINELSARRGSREVDKDPSIDIYSCKIILI